MNQNKIITFIYIEVVNEFARPEDCHKLSRVVLLPGGHCYCYLPFSILVSVCTSTEKVFISIPSKDTSTANVDLQYGHIHAV